jgi:hypothetical protein
MTQDGSPYVELGLYPDDTFDHVRVLQVLASEALQTAQRSKYSPG